MSWSLTCAPWMCGPPSQHVAKCIPPWTWEAKGALKERPRTEGEESGFRLAAAGGIGTSFDPRKAPCANTRSPRTFLTRAEAGLLRRKELVPQTCSLSSWGGEGCALLPLRTRGGRAPSKPCREVVTEPALASARAGSQGACPSPACPGPAADAGSHAPQSWGCGAEENQRPLVFAAPWVPFKQKAWLAFLICFFNYSYFICVCFPFQTSCGRQGRWQLQAAPVEIKLDVQCLGFPCRSTGSGQCRFPQRLTWGFRLRFLPAAHFSSQS